MFRTFFQWLKNTWNSFFHPKKEEPVFEEIVLPGKVPEDDIIVIRFTNESEGEEAHVEIDNQNLSNQKSDRFSSEVDRLSDEQTTQESNNLKISSEDYVKYVKDEIETEQAQQIIKDFSPASIEDCEKYAQLYVDNGIIADSGKENLIKVWLRSEITLMDLREKSEKAVAIWQSKVG